jgi:hypothetical protein
MNSKTDEIIITTKNNAAVDKIIALSKEYPTEVFRVKVAGEDIYENYVYLYECSNGDLKPVKEGYEYCFCIKISDRDKLDKVVFDTFKKKVADLYKRIGQVPFKDVNLVLTFDDNLDEREDSNLSIIVEYKVPNVRLTAKKLGITCIEVEVEFFDAKGKSMKQENQPQNELYEELPF